MMLKKTIISFLLIFISACGKSPTGRSQFLYMPNAEIEQMGLQAFEQLKQVNPINQDVALNQFVRCISEALTYESGGDWEVVFFDDDSLNAFALPANKIGVHTGLINLVDNQDQLAAVIGHEIGHVIAQHSNERLSQKTAVDKGVVLISAISRPESTLGKVALSSLGVGAQYGIILPFSRTHESEADILGLDYMAKAGFDPRESVRLWQKMSAASNGPKPAEFLSTHPSHESRINDLNENMPKAMSFFQNAQAIGKRPDCKK